MANPLDKLAQLRALYVQKLPEKCQAIDDLAQDPAGLAELQVHVHRLSGSAGAYGLVEVSTAARNLDLLLQQSAAPDIEKPLQELKRQIDAARTVQASHLPACDTESSD
jgi:HPt (histidine-containing phosphotransfer) domain-containing protein